MVASRSWDISGGMSLDDKITLPLISCTSITAKSTRQGERPKCAAVGRFTNGTQLHYAK